MCLQKKPEMRPSLQEVMEHPFFEGIDWDAMANRKVTPPYKPLLENLDDLNHFDEEITGLPIESPQGENSGCG